MDDVKVTEKPGGAIEVMCPFCGFLCKSTPIGDPNKGEDIDYDVEACLHLGDYDEYFGTVEFREN